MHGCPSETDTDDDEDDEALQKKARDDVVHFKIVFNKMLAKTEDDLAKMVKKFKKRGYNTAEAKHYANEEIREDNIKTFFDLYKQILVYILHLHRSTLHHIILDTAFSLVKLCVCPEIAAQEAIKKYCNLFDVHGWLDDIQDVDTEEDEDEHDSGYEAEDDGTENDSGYETEDD